MKNKNSWKDINGVFILDKPVGLSSNQALQKARRIFQAKKAGHTGSLDVLATGLLPICFGEATKFSQYLLDADKTYYAVAQLGKRTTTCDAEGDVVEEKSTAQVDLELIKNTLEKFTGEIEQVPSMFSALKHKGQPLYKLARKGVEVERKKRKVTVFVLELLRFHNDLLELNIHCSKGTYIRNLVDDIGQALNCGAYVKELRRLAAGPFQPDQMHTLEEITPVENLQPYVLPVDALLTAFPAITLPEEKVNQLKQGQKIQISQSADQGICRVYDEKQQLVGLVECLPDNVLKVKRLVSTQL